MRLRRPSIPSVSRRSFLTGLGGLALAHPFLWGCGDNTTPGPTKPVPSAPPPYDPNKPWWVNHNYAPVEESEAVNLPVEGAIPPTLAGLYLRNGPNPLSGESGHWFAGDGMVHGVRVEGGKAPWYRARYIQTDILGAPPAPGGPPELTENPANTSVVNHANRLLCLVEIGLPYEISPADLATLGPYDFAGLLTGSMTAHPKIDPVTGELIFFGYNILDSSITYRRVNAQGVLVSSETIPLPASTMMHDFQVTETHVLFLDLPVVFDLNLAIAGSPIPFLWKPDNGARIGVMPRTGTAADVQWIDVDPCFVFHTWNAFHETSDPAVIHLDAVRYPTMFEGDSSTFSNQGVPGRFTLSLGQATATWTPFDDLQVEFPRISPRRQGLPYRYGYGIAVEPRPPAGEVFAANRIVKYDRQTGTSEQYITPAGHDIDETVFVPDPAGSAEDDGWMLAYVFDHAVNRSHLLILDATSLAKPVARILLPTRVPHGFHGDFVPSAT